MSKKGFANGCIEFLQGSGHTPLASHNCLYSKNDNTFHNIAPDTTDYEIIQSVGWQTFTPTVTLVGGAGNTVPVYTTNSGRYCQMGKVVYVEVLLDKDGGTDGAGTGQINVALPVTAGLNKVNGSMGIIVGQGVGGGNDYILSGIIANSATTVKLYKFSSITATSSFVGNDQPNGSRAIRLNFWYEVD